MSQWSIPAKPTLHGWKLRVLSGRMLGTEFDLPNPRYVLGSQPPSDITIPHPDIAPRHVALELRPDGVRLSDCSGRGFVVNGRHVKSAHVAPGDHVEVGPLKFEFSNPNYRPPTRPGSPDSLWTHIEKVPLWIRVGVVTSLVAGVLFVLLACTGTPTLVPVTLMAMSAVVPATVICWLVQKFDKRGISFHTLALTFLAGGTVGVIAAMFNFLVAESLAVFLGVELITLAMFAGFAEEPAKLLGTAWRWRHPGYDRPMDGLLLGTVSGFGFAVIETAGYGFQELWAALEASAAEGTEMSFAGMLGVMMLRGLTSPFAHGLWSGILAAGFWAAGRDWRRAVRSKEFWASAALAIGLHGLWNSVEFCGYFGMVASAILSVIVYRQLLRKKGYLSLDRNFWSR